MSACPRHELTWAPALNQRDGVYLSFTIHPQFDRPHRIPSVDWGLSEPEHELTSDKRLRVGGNGAEGGTDAVVSVFASNRQQSVAEPIQPVLLNCSKISIVLLPCQPHAIFIESASRKAIVTDNQSVETWKSMFATVTTDTSERSTEPMWANFQVVTEFHVCDGTPGLLNVVDDPDAGRGGHDLPLFVSTETKTFRSADTGVTKPEFNSLSDQSRKKRSILSADGAKWATTVQSVVAMTARGVQARVLSIRLVSTISNGTAKNSVALAAANTIWSRLGPGCYSLRLASLSFAATAGTQVSAYALHVEPGGRQSHIDRMGLCGPIGLYSSGSPDVNFSASQSLARGTRAETGKIASPYPPILSGARLFGDFAWCRKRHYTLPFRTQRSSRIRRWAPM